MTRKITWHEFVTGGYNGYDEHLRWSTEERANKNAKDLEDQGFKTFVVENLKGQFVVYKR